MTDRPGNILEYGACVRQERSHCITISVTKSQAASYYRITDPSQREDHRAQRAYNTRHMLTYAEYFQATASPFGGSAEHNEAYDTIFGYFSPTSTHSPSWAVGALRIFVVDARGEPRLQLVHGPRKYPGPLAQPSPNKDKFFGYLDDIEGEAGELVLVDSDMLSQTTASRVLLLEHHMAELVAHGQRPSIPVVPEGTGHSELIQAHKAFFAPFKLVPFLLGEGLSPREAMEILHPQLNHGGVAGTAHTVPAGNPMLLQPGPPFQIEPSLTNYMKHKVMYWDLPSLLRPRAPPGDPALTAAVTALTINFLLKLAVELIQSKGKEEQQEL
eukprot:jgi/Psemu1/12738/gm1.12738_g